ncbi:unnamed protein product [Cuscuta campestris]|uniref:UBA domain-containing protein n=1 Tax=Cuscuta campestris TaxID=132261 RepID=A0A484MIX4_9ASTE|nr:unnamed protein product [Cuscuta campestris]
MGMAKLKIAGAWSGVLEVEPEEWTVAMLREEVVRRSGCVPPESVNLISAGKLLKDGDGSEKLSQFGIKYNAKILASKVSLDKGKSFKEESLAEEERSSRLSRLKAAATALSKRHAEGTLPVEDFNLELENQSGEKVQLGSDTDQRAIMMGLMLHANGKALIRKQQFKEALEVLTMGEEAFSLCNPKVIELVDNVAILQIDLVWCYFMLKDMSWLSDAGARLAKAREGLERAHGKEASRVRLLQGGRYLEVALEQRLYGMTALKKPVNLHYLNELVLVGFEKGLAVEALRRNENDMQKALDDLTNPQTNSAIQQHIESNKKKRLRNAQNAAIEQIAAMGFPRESVIAAVRTFGTRQTALNNLLGQSSSSITCNLAPVGNEGSLGQDGNFPNNDGEQAPGRNDDLEEDAFGDQSETGLVQEETRDVEMERELTEELLKGDAYSDYDLELTKEGEAIAQYLTLLTSSS